MPPVKPMLAKAVKGVPEPDSVAGGLLYEPKWDGFRCIVFRDGDEVELGSRNEKPLTRYFPELPPALRANLPEQCVLDGEIVIPGEGGLQFDALLNRIHPAASRINMLAEQTTPARCTTSAWPPRSAWRRARSSSPSSSRCERTPSRATPGNRGPRPRATRPSAGPVPATGGTPARTCPGSRSGWSGSPRSATT